MSPGEAAAVLTVDRLRADFGAEAGLQDISFNVVAEELLVVVGTSGAGKSTLLRALAGLAPVQAGTVEIDGRDVTGEPTERRNAVYLHQSPVLFPHMTVGENVAFPLRVRGVPHHDRLPRVLQALAAVRLSGMEGRRPGTLSGGQLHRVALARAVVARPALLLLDEPLSSLDPSLRGEVRESIRATRQAYRPAIVLVTHDLEEAGRLGDRIAVLIDGRFVQVAGPDELFSRPGSLRVARFLGLGNEVTGHVEAGSFNCALGRLPLPVRVRAGGAVAVLGLSGVIAVDEGPYSGVVTAVTHGSAGAVAAIGTPAGTLEVRAPHPAPPVGALVRYRVVLDPDRVYADDSHDR